MFDAGRSIDGRFEHAGDAGVHYVRIGAAQYGIDHNDWKINRGNTVNADTLISD